MLQQRYYFTTNRKKPCIHSNYMYKGSQDESPICQALYQLSAHLCPLCASGGLPTSTLLLILLPRCVPPPKHVPSTYKLVFLGFHRPGIQPSHTARAIRSSSAAICPISPKTAKKRPKQPLRSDKSRRNQAMPGQTKYRRCKLHSIRALPA